jgi:hypothetical protein
MALILPESRAFRTKDRALYRSERKAPSHQAPNSGFARYAIDGSAARLLHCGNRPMDGSMDEWKDFHGIDPTRLHDRSTGGHHRR